MCVGLKAAAAAFDLSATASSPKLTYIKTMRKMNPRLLD